MVIWVVKFSSGGTELERFLIKNQHTQRKLSWGGVKKCQNFTFIVNFLRQKWSESFSFFSCSFRGLSKAPKHPYVSYECFLTLPFYMSWCHNSNLLIIIIPVLKWEAIWRIHPHTFLLASFELRNLSCQICSRIYCNAIIILASLIWA
jgi:hypothetical protein